MRRVVYTQVSWMCACVVECCERAEFMIMQPATMFFAFDVHALQHTFTNFTLLVARPNTRTLVQLFSCFDQSVMSGMNGWWKYAADNILNSMQIVRVCVFVCCVRLVVFCAVEWLWSVWLACCVFRLVVRPKKIWSVLPDRNRSLGMHATRAANANTRACG